MKKRERVLSDGSEARHSSVMKNKPHSSLCSIGIVLVAAIAAASCSAINDVSPENLGDTGVELIPSVPGQAPFSTPAAEFLGTWEGEAEDPLALAADPGGVPPVYRFPSGSSRIRLSIAVGPPPFLSIQGTLIFGDAEPPAPPLDPDVGYPVGVSYAELLNYSPEYEDQILNTDQLLPPTEGFEYPAFRLPNVSELIPGSEGFANVADGVLKLSYHTTEILRDWCHLQTPHADDKRGFDCNGGSVGFREDGGCFLVPYEASDLCTDPECTGYSSPIDCDKAFLCKYDHCACNSSLCAVNAGSSAEFRSRAELSLRRVGDELVGAVTNAVFMNPRGLATPLGRIRFHRAE
jgi:hypothetical protein